MPTQPTPDYAALTRLLLEPLVEDLTTLTVDREITCGGSKIWLRVAFDPKDKGRVLGRGGRTLQAIRQLLAAAAQMVQQQVHLDLYEPQGSRPREDRPTLVRERS
ncbi:MAG: KH domain-containing protein [Cyanobacteriota bacterium]|nr:KH domain-containing protein [Cyanobacteriota bacterium]